MSIDILQSFVKKLIQRAKSQKNWKDSYIIHIVIDEDGFIQAQAGFSIKGCWHEDYVEFKHEEIKECIEEAIEAKQ